MAILGNKNKSLEILKIVQPYCADFTLDSSGAIKVEEATSMEIWNILSFMHLWAKDLSWRQGTVLMGLPFYATKCLAWEFRNFNCTLLTLD